MKSSLITLMLGSLILFVNLGSLRATPSALEIITQVEARNKGDKSIAVMEMILIDQKESERQRQLKIFSKDRGKDELKLMFFVAPADVYNTGFLTYSYDQADKDDDQWLFLPALKKSKRIAASDKSGSFMGSDFTYSDMSTRKISDYTYKIKSEKVVRGNKTWVLEVTPKTPAVIDETGYKKSFVFVRQDNHVVVRALHILKEEGTKRYMDVKKLELIDGIWVATEVEMKTMKGKARTHSTLLRIKEIKFNQTLEDSFFSLRKLEKGL